MNLKKLNSVIFKVFCLIIGFTFGYFIMSKVIDTKIIEITNKYVLFGSKIAIGLIFALILYLLSTRIQQALKQTIRQIEVELSKRPLYEIVFSTIGLILGLLIAFLLSQLINSLPIGFFGSIISLIIYIIFGYLGISIFNRNKDYILSIFKDRDFSLRSKSQSELPVVTKVGSDKKVLDTSTIIDGRILEIVKAGFIEGDLLLPLFILEELQHIADSSDSLKRNRGRRGLEVINNIRELQSINVVIIDKAYEEIEEVDSKLVKLALEENAKILTNDFNLNKVAEVQGIQVLNINELANALKPIAIPGETMIIQIVKEGQEHNQGVAYLDDGTMIVVENGKKNIGETKEVLVTSVLQTNAGKMIFAKIK